MVSFKEIQFNKKEAVYPQLVAYVKKQILIGSVENNEELPSRRELALSLAINPNTVQKAYKILEDEGIIRTISNVKSVICVNEEIKETIQKEYIQKHLKGFIDECKSVHLSFQEVVSLLSEYW
ncbi:GntR family transcriptional regulator [Amedibacterium intestinale]|uniref:GntR family transcriptional regulator n=1 Tax=Amedibacterium intestinale TaxID=2583452 RepID=UPI000E4835FD|nr:GntR family transcriptional regulator [Amedibacterium intestinale]RHO21979.1 GntR family transcriptional regulator [Eubacterium sp. AM18-26]RHO27436.1 GntR family transcriptional regulator [Eubacterium sp. AM18-10LB-B]